VWRTIDCYKSTVIIFLKSWTLFWSVLAVLYSEVQPQYANQQTGCSVAGAVFFCRAALYLMVFWLCVVALMVAFITSFALIATNGMAYCWTEMPCIVCICWLVCLLSGSCATWWVPSVLWHTGDWLLLAELKWHYGIPKVFETVTEWPASSVSKHWKMVLYQNTRADQGYNFSESISLAAVLSKVDDFVTF